MITTFISNMGSSFVGLTRLSWRKVWDRGQVAKHVTVVWYLLQSYRTRSSIAVGTAAEEAWIFVTSA